MLELIKAIEAVKFDPNARVIILKSTTPGIFCAGADLKVSRLVEVVVSTLSFKRKNSCDEILLQSDPLFS